MTPDAHTIQETFLDVGDGHTLYIHDWGHQNSDKPILFLHGGPGGGCKDRHKSRFDPSRQRVIFFDQRGCGRSTPYGSLEHNTTQDLVDDIEKIRQHLGLEQLIITGGSWGSCLALAYGLAYPQQVSGLVLEGIFTGSHDEIAWLDEGRFRTFFPDAWDQYLQATPEAHHTSPSPYHFERILGNDQAAAKQSGYAYQNLEGSIIALDDRFTPENLDDFDPANIRIEVHYLQNGCFMPDKHILQNAHRLTMPVYLVQGRYDMVCPPVFAYELASQLPQVELMWTVSGHRAERETWSLMRAIMLELTKRTGDGPA